MTLPFLQIMVGLGIGILGFLLLRPAPLTYGNNDHHSSSRPRPTAGPDKRKRSKKSEPTFLSKPDDLCLICLEKMSTENMSYMQCGHALHDRCYEDLRHRRIDECPACRGKM